MEIIDDFINFISKKTEQNDPLPKQIIRLIDPQFSWQSNYHEHIIRNEKSEQRISEYIIENPQNWNTDKNYFFRKQTNNQKSRKKLKNLNF